MAAWCLVMHQPPEVYRQLTRVERDAFISVYEEMHSKR
jgi:hypothetical protein